MSPYDLLPRFKAQYDMNNQEFSISGVVRPQSIDELAPSIALLRDSIDRVRGVLYVNIKRLTQMNNTAFHVFSRVIIDACRTRPDLKFVVVTSSVVGWTTRKFGRLNGIEPNITVEEYDSRVLSGAELPRRRRVHSDPAHADEVDLAPRAHNPAAARHAALVSSMADICCGIGDFAVLVQKRVPAVADRRPRPLQVKPRLCAKRGCGVRHQGD